jgi:hypothetical protein
MKNEKSQPSRDASASEGNTLAAAFQRAHLRVDVAKQRMRLAKEELKRARKRFKEAKRMVKKARKEASAARKAWKRAEPNAMKQPEKKVLTKETPVAAPSKARTRLKVAGRRKSVAAKRANESVH